MNHSITKIIAISIFIFATQLAIAQQVKVIDKQSHVPVENVQLIGKEAVAFTNVKGHVNISRFIDGEFIEFSHPYYKKLRISRKQLKEKNYIVLIEEDPVQLNEVVISANKRAQKRSEVAVKIASILPEQVQLFNPQTGADLVGINSEVFIQKSQLGGGSPMMRGFAANRVLLVVDGVRMNNAIFRSGNLQNVIAIDAGGVEKIEVIFGPSSVIYGSDALGGVLNFQTLTPRLATDKYQLSSHALARYSSANNEKSAHFDFNYGVEKWAFVTSITYSDYGDLKMGSHKYPEYQKPFYVVPSVDEDLVVDNSDPNLQRNSGFDQLNVMQKVRFRPNDYFDLLLSTHYSQSSDVPRYDRLIQLSKGVPKYAEWYYGPQKWSMQHLRATYSKPNSLFDLVSVNAAYQQYEESRHDRKLNKGSIRERTEKVDALSLNIDFDKRLDDATSIYYGFELINNDVTSLGLKRNITTDETEDYASRYPDGSSYMTAAVYACVKAKFSSELTLNTGVRYNYTWSSGEFDDRFYDFPFDDFKNRNGALTGNIGIVYHPDEQLQINMHASTGFRAPNIDDAAKVFDSEPGTVIVPNPDLKPEYAANFELDLIYNFTQNAKVELSGYYTRLYNAMVRRDFSLGGKTEMMYDGELSTIKALQNASDANIFGVNASVTARIAEPLLFKSNLSYQRGRDDEDMPLRHIAPMFGSTHLITTIRYVRFDLYARYNGKVNYDDLADDERGKPHIYASDNDGNPYSPSWFTLNLKSTVHLNKHLKLNLGVENIADLRYRPYSSGIVAPGRNFIVALRASV